jgi:micrococcal nuclease
MNWVRLIIQILELIFGGRTQQSAGTKKRNYSKQSGRNAGKISDFNALKPMEKIEVKLQHHVDGDTEEFIYNHQRFRARFLMIDTPETKKEGQGVMKFGPEASNFTKNAEMNANKLEIAFDKGPRVDDYGRYLVYVYADGKNISEELLRRGLAIVRYVNEPNNSLEMDYKKAEAEARQNRKGVWSVDNYVFEKSKRPGERYPEYQYNNDILA